MSLFLVVPIKQNGTLLKNNIKHNLPAEDVYEIANNVGYLVKFSGTSKELCEKLEIFTEDLSQQRVGSAIVTLVTSYYGFGSTEMWEWMRSRMEGK